MDPIGLWVLGTAGLFFSVFFSTAIGSLQSYSKLKLESLFRSQSGKKRLKAYIERSDEILLSVRVLNALSNILLVIAITFLVATRIQTQWVTVLLALVFSLLIVVFIGQTQG